MKYMLLAFGILAVAIGIAIYGWVIYNMFLPTKEFNKSAGFSAGQYIFPGLMIFYGVKWIANFRFAPVPKKSSGDEKVVILKDR